MQPSSVDGVALFSDLVHTLTRDSRTCTVRVTDGIREGHLRFEQGELVEIHFGQLRGASAMVALMAADGLHHELLEPPHATEEAKGPADEETHVHENEAAALSPVQAPPSQAEASPAPPQSEAPGPEVEAEAGVLAPVDTPPWESEASVAQFHAAQPARDEREPETGDAETGDALLPAELPPWETEVGDEPFPALPPASENGAQAEAPRTEPASVASEPEGDRSDAASEPETDRSDAASEPETDRSDVGALQSGDRTPAAAESLPQGIPESETDRGAAGDRKAAQPVAARRSDWPPPNRSNAAVWASLAVGVLVLLAALPLWKSGSRPQPGAKPPPGSQRAPDRTLSTPPPLRASISAEARPPEWREGPAVVAPPGSALLPTIRLRVLVGPDGAVRAAEVVASRPSLALFEARAIETARQHCYQAATRGGAPVEAWTTLLLAFEPAPVHADDVVIKGSEVIASALGSAWAEAFESSHAGLQVRVEALGTKTGFAGLFDGTADLAAASHAIGDDELALAAKLGLTLREVALGQDGVAVIVHPDNPVRELDLDTLARIFTRQVKRWDELSGDAAPIRVLVRPSYSGTRQSFEERVLAGHEPEPPTLESAPERVETGREVVERVAGDVHAVGYVSLGLLQPSVRAIALKERPDALAVVPSQASVRDGSYPLPQPLLLYLRTDAAYGARAFAQFALSRAGQDLLPSHGLVALSSPGPRFELGAPPPRSLAAAPELTRIYFKSNSAHIAAAPWEEVWAQAARLRAGRRALVIGHTDSDGDAEVNRRLARFRAGVVINVLRRTGGGRAPIELEVARSEYPVASNETAEGKRANRRVDLYVLPRAAPNLGER